MHTGRGSVAAAAAERYSPTSSSSSSVFGEEGPPPSKAAAAALGADCALDGLLALSQRPTTVRRRSGDRQVLASVRPLLFRLLFWTTLGPSVRSREVGSENVIVFVVR